MGVLKKLVSWAAQSDPLWRVLDWTVLRAARFAENERRRLMFDRRQAELVRHLFPDLTVRHGPFAGVQYPKAVAVCSALLPKLLGSYERELHGALERACGRSYRVVVDVGCAEGYYAVGLAKRLPTTAIRAFDTDPAARSLCRAMAEANGVSGQVTIGEHCGPDQLREVVAGRQALVVCDCEGYELDLLTPAVVPALAASEILVETHEFAGDKVADTLSGRFSATHKVEVVASTDDAVKGRMYKYPELVPLTSADRDFVLAERRPGVMEWLVLTPHCSR
ncbi:MAG: hypothetical protein C0467_13755 [Planctomycetaceae bacterium]|nr:hypothetical protein [Planctomycetaceae bacterium]